MTQDADGCAAARARREARRRTGRRAFAAVAWTGLALAGCSLDLKGELDGQGDDDAAGNPNPLDRSDAAPDDGGAGADATTSVDDASASADARIPETSDTSALGSHDAQGNVANDANAPTTDAPSLGDAPNPGEGGSICNFGGTWGMKMTIAVDWIPQGITSIFIAPGQGTIVQWVKSTRVQTGNTTTESASVCGIALPDFSGTNFVGGETYGVRFPASLFDVIAPDGGWSDHIPPFTTTGTLSDSTPNATYTTTLSAALMGLTLANPTTATWPATINTAVDTDQDGNYGITIATAQGSPYSDVPVDISKTRANQLYVVIRQVSSLSGAASDCDHISGTATIPKLPSPQGGPTSNGKYAIDSHIIGCGLVGGGKCSPAQASFADGTQPVFSPSGTTVFTSVRVASNATCADVRQLLP